MPNRIPTPGVPPVGVRSDAVDNRHINTVQHGTIGGKTKTPAKAQGPINFNKTIGRDKMIGKAQDALQKKRVKGGTYNSSGTN